MREHEHKNSSTRKVEGYWKKYLEQFSAPNTNWPNDKWREPFELVGASLIYTFNAMELMPESMFHEVVRPSKRDSQRILKLLNDDKKPDFRQNVDEEFNELVSTMHMASSSFRLPTALYLAHRKPGPLTKLLKGKDESSEWDRDELKKYRQQARQLVCCKVNKPLNEHKHAKEVAFTMILDHRDEFGHGEQGRKKRFKSVSELCLCRIFEAQLLLAELGVDQLARLKMKRATSYPIDLAKTDAKLRAWRERYNTSKKVAVLHCKSFLKRVAESRAFDGQPVGIARLR